MPVLAESRLWKHRKHGEVVILDNRDSFVFNLAHRLWESGEREVSVVRSDALEVETLVAWKPRALVVSPGPGHPSDAGISVEAITHFSGKIPILGVCLGHQAIAVAFGGRVSVNGTPRHGKTSLVRHDGKGIFSGVSPQLEVGRYHSLEVERPLPEDLEATAWCGESLMGLRHVEHPTVGVQFHPESVLTPAGSALLSGFLEVCRLHQVGP